jgi:ATP-binding cassette, subfamily B, bacterial HlyB/CyaB
VGILNSDEQNLLRSRSILNLIFPEAELNELIETLEVEAFEAGEVIIEQGENPEEFFIPITGMVELFSVVGLEDIVNGFVQPGRSLNTYSVLRQNPYQYSARFQEAGTLVRIPASLIQERLDAYPELRSYLLGMTESQDIRTLSKEIQSIGCSTDFKIHFIAALKPKNFNPQEWIIDPGSIPTEAIYLVEGNLISQKAQAQVGEQVLRIPVPARSWFGWNQVVEGRESKTLLKSISPARILSLSKVTLENLQEDFPEDFSLYHETVSAGRLSEVDQEDDQEGEAFDIEEIIRSQKTPKRMFWQSYPWVQQSDEMDCGPACLAMVSSYFQRKIPIQYWRSQLSTGRDGTSLFDLALISERNGFMAQALAVEDLTELGKRSFPVVALRQYHYMVVYSASKKWITVGDPGIGIVRMKPEEFYEGYEQAVLFLKPTDAFFNLPIPKGQYGHFLIMLSELKPELILSLCVSLVMVVLGLLTPILSQIFLDDILVNRDENLLKIVLGVAIGLSFIQGFLGWARAYYSNFLAIKFSFRANSVFMRKMLSLNFKFFADRHVGDFTKRLSEMDKIRDFLLNTAEDLAVAFLSVAVYTAALLIYSPLVAGVFFATVPFFFLLSYISGSKLSTLYQTVFKESAEIGSNVTDTIKAIATVKSMGAETACRWRYEEKFVNLSQAERKFALTASGLQVSSSLFTSLVNYLIMGLCGFFAIKGELSPGQVVAVTMISGNILRPLLSICEKIDDIQEIKAAMGRINDILLAPSEGAEHQGRLKKDFLRGEIEFKDVWFRYGGEGSDWVLKGVSFKIEPGQNVAFVGPSGSGKSTIANLVARMYEPTKGQIFIDGRDYLDYEVAWLRSQLGILQQESHLFHGPIFENIAFSDPNVDIARVVTAAEEAAAHEFIIKKPGEYFYMISQGGYGLSGGEKQRISVARMLYQRPKILVLDEATSALDGIAEKTLLDNLKSKVKGTTINIAHRYSTVLHSDYALVLLEGKVVGFGTHSDLIEENDVYRSLFGDALNLESPPPIKGLLQFNSKKETA